MWSILRKVHRLAMRFAWGRHPTFAGALHVFQLFWEPQYGLVILFALGGKEVQQRRVLTDGFCVSELQKKNKKETKRVSIKLQIRRRRLNILHRTAIDHFHSAGINVDSNASLTCDETWYKYNCQTVMCTCCCKPTYVTLYFPPHVQCTCGNRMHCRRGNRKLRVIAISEAWRD